MTTKAPFDGADAVDDPGFPTDHRYAEVTEQIFADTQVLNADSGALAIFDSSGLIHAEVFGSDLTGNPLEPGAQSRMGSLAKVFASILVNRQIEASSYSYEDRLVELLPALCKH